MIDYIIQLNFYNYLIYSDYINLLQTSKTNYYCTAYNNDLIYKYYISNKFSYKFAMDALPIIYSYRDFLYRIIVFENSLKRVGYPIWKEDIYYAYWKAQNIFELQGQYILDITMI